MTIDEAIKELEALLINRKSELLRDTLEALPLGIEALKEVKASREEDYIGDTGLLPGETEE